TARATKALAKLGREPPTLVPMANPSLEALRRVLWLLETVDAAASWHMAPATLAFGEAVRARGVKVLLTGEGADELFLGYPVQRAAREGAAIPELVISGGIPVPIPAVWRAWLSASRARVRHVALASISTFALEDEMSALAGRRIELPPLVATDETPGPLARK